MPSWGGGDRGAGGVQEAGEKGAGSGIPKVAGSGRKREKLRNIAQYLQLKKCKEAGANKYRTGTGIKGYRERQVSTPLFPPPPPTCPLGKYTLLALAKFLLAQVLKNFSKSHYLWTLIFCPETGT